MSYKKRYPCVKFSCKVFRRVNLAPSTCKSPRRPGNRPRRLRDSTAACCWSLKRDEKKIKERIIKNTKIALISVKTAEATPFTGQQNRCSRHPYAPRGRTVKELCKIFRHSPWMSPPAAVAKLAAGARRRALRAGCGPFRTVWNRPRRASRQRSDGDIGNVA
jgi:hypothetical protein